MHVLSIDGCPVGYGGSMDAEIIVRGTGQARALPDRAVLTVRVEGEGPLQDEAYRSAVEQSNRVDEILARHAAAIDRTTTAAVVVHPKTRWRKGETIRTGWLASRTTVIDIIDFAGLGELITELAGAGPELSGPHWQLDPTNPVHGEARRRAADDARRRAEDYADRLGLTIVTVAWVAEPGLRQTDPAGGGFLDQLGGARMVMAAGGVDEEAMNVTPDEMTVRAAVEVAFTFGGPSPGL